MPTALTPLFVALGAVLLATPAAYATDLVGTPKVTFHAEGSPGVLTFDGVTRQLSLVDNGDTLVFTVPMDTVETGISLRDDHMRRNYVETETYPNAVLTLQKSAVTWPAAGAKSSEGNLTAQFEAHGVSRDVTVAYTIKTTKDALRVKASFPFDTSSHGIAIPEYLGVTIKPAMVADVVVDLRP